MKVSVVINTNALGRPDIAPNVTHQKRPGDIRHCVGDPMKLAFAMPWYPLVFEDGVTRYAEALLHDHVPVQG